jgi:hypothetical protein
LTETKFGYKRQYAANPDLPGMPFDWWVGPRPKTKGIEKKTKKFFPPFDKLFRGKDMELPASTKVMKEVVEKKYLAQRKLPREQWGQLRQATVNGDPSELEGNTGLKRKRSATVNMEYEDDFKDAKSCPVEDEIGAAMEMSDNELIAAWEEGAFKYQSFANLEVSARLSDAYLNRGDVISKVLIRNASIELMGSLDDHPTPNSSPYWVQNTSGRETMTQRARIPKEAKKKTGKAVRDEEIDLTGSHESFREYTNSKMRISDYLRMLAGRPPFRATKSPLVRHLEKLARS